LRDGPPSSDPTSRGQPQSGDPRAASRAVDKGTWIDPSSGERRRIGAFQYADVEEFVTPEGWEDALVLLEAD